MVHVERLAADVRTFYEAAVERDAIFFARTLALMKSHGEDRAVLVTGGFHAQGIAARARRAGFRALFIRLGVSSEEIEAGEKRYAATMGSQAPVKL